MNPIRNAQDCATFSNRPSASKRSPSMKVLMPPTLNHVTVSSIENVFSPLTITNGLRCGKISEISTEAKSKLCSCSSVIPELVIIEPLIRLFPKHLSQIIAIGLRHHRNLVPNGSICGAAFHSINEYLVAVQ